MRLGIRQCVHNDPPGIVMLLSQFLTHSSSGDGLEKNRRDAVHIYKVRSIIVSTYMLQQLFLLVADVPWVLNALCWLSSGDPKTVHPET